MSERERSVESPAWPYASLFIFGFFGTGSPGGKRLAWRTSGALALVLVGMVLTGAPSPAVALAGAAVIPVGVLGIAISYTSYLRELDELSRLIQLEAFALSYLAGGVIVGILGGISLAFPELWGFSTWGGPVAPVFWIILAEPFRGLALVLRARRYR